MATTYYGGSYTTQDLEDLQRRVDEANQSLLNYDTTQTSDDELRQRAESEYDPLYHAQTEEQEALKRSAQTQLDERLGALERQYTRNAQYTNKNYDTQRATTNNSMLARGMNNSSLALAMLNRVEDQRNQALNDLTAERTASETSARNDYTNAVTAADAAIARLGSDRAANIDARFQALRDAERERVFNARTAQNQLTQYVASLMLQIESLRQQGYSQYLQQQQAAAEQALAREQFEWQKQFDQDQFNWQKEQAAAKSSGGSSSSRSTSSGSAKKSSGGLSSAITGSLKSAGNAAGSWLQQMLKAYGKSQSNATKSTTKSGGSIGGSSKQKSSQKYRTSVGG